MPNFPHPIALSLFSGAAGLDIGFHQTGFRIIACVEKEKSCCQTLQLNFGRYLEPDCQILQRDIKQLQPDEIFVDHIDFIIGGPPCQSFSAIGRRAGGIDGIRDERGNLFEHYCRLVKHYQPKGFLFENVRGILGANQGKDWQFIVKAFAQLGYQLFYRILDCADYGVPQHRERLILVGTKEGTFKFPRPTYGTDSLNQQPYVTAIDAIADLQEPDETLHSYSGKYGKLLEQVPPGMNYHYFTREMGYPNPIFAWRSRFSDFLYKAEPEKPVRTIVAKMGAYSGPFHWKNRKFTLQEFKRLQTFPDDYNFISNINTALQQLGNSVPPIFAEQLAKAVLQQLFGVPLNLELLEEDEKLSFDRRKSTKAKSTRTKRLTPDQYLQLDLFKSNSALSDSQQAKKILKSTYYNTDFFYYPSYQQRIKIKALSFYETGSIYRFYTQRVRENCFIDVQQYEYEKFVTTPLLRYTLEFSCLVGDGIKRIECTLLSNSSKDIPVAWDAIEDCLSNFSGYQTMMDIYGHFTEPHPIFELRMDILTKKTSFLLQFAKEFSAFDATKKVLPGEFLQNLYGQDQSFDLAKVACTLRGLRFDVRVHETNNNIPPGYFRCCYPFTININKQISVTWKSKTQLSNSQLMNNYNEQLSQAFIQAEELVQAENVDEAISNYKNTQITLSYLLKTLENGNEVSLNKMVAEGLETIVNNIGQNKYLYSILITSLVEKLVHPYQDIRYAQERLPGGYSNRSTDAAHVTPFLKRHGLTSCAASGAESGRNFERPYPYNLNYDAQPKGKGNKQAFLGLIHAIQVEGVDPFSCIVLLMALDLRRNKQKAVFKYPQPKGITIQKIFDAVLKHHQNAQGHGRSRLPVLAIQAIYQCLVVELSRYKDTTLRNPPNRHTANDKEGWIGDIQIDRLDGTPFEGVEVKSGIKITSDMVRALPEKFAGYAVERYYILSTAEPHIAKNEFDELMQIVEQVRQKTGCQVIVNGLNQSLRYYLRLVSDPSKFLINYTEQIQRDLDVKDEHRELWAQILITLDQVTSA